MRWDCFLIICDFKKNRLISSIINLSSIAFISSKYQVFNLSSSVYFSLTVFFIRGRETPLMSYFHQLNLAVLVITSSVIAHFRRIMRYCLIRTFRQKSHSRDNAHPLNLLTWFTFRMVSSSVYTHICSTRWHMIHTSTRASYTALSAASMKTHSLVNRMAAIIKSARSVSPK